MKNAKKIVKEYRDAVEKAACDEFTYEEDEFEAHIACQEIEEKLIHYIRWIQKQYRKRKNERGCI